MGWFPTTLDSEAQSWRFDIVSLLAIIGGSSIEKHKQAITASPFAGFPRILPAPESLLDTDRPNRLPSVKEVTIIGVKSGTRFTELNFFANVIHKLEELEEYEFRSYKITYREPEKDTIKSAAEVDDVESGGTQNDAEQKSQPDDDKKEVIVPLKSLSALNLVTLISILMTIGLFIWAGMIHDGVALVALAAMSLSTSAACLSAQWYPRLSTRTTKAKVTKGDIVMKTRNGAFIVVECPEEITRELYGGAESCRYVFKTRGHQALLACSTVLLMAAIILFSNCGWTMQIAVGVAYIILNILYFALALLMDPGEMWDLSRRYDVKTVRTAKTRSYTRALWEAIRETSEIAWVRKGGLAPSTDAWDRWLDEAKNNCGKNAALWDPEEARDRLMSQASTEESATSMEIQPRAPPQMSASK